MKKLADFFDKKQDLREADSSNLGSFDTRALGAAAMSIAASGSMLGCGGGDEGYDSGGEKLSLTPLSLGTMSDREAARFLHQTVFSARLEDIAELKMLGRAGWLNKQFTAPYNANWAFNKTKRLQNNPNAFSGAAAWSICADVIWESLFVNPGLRERVALALSEIIVFAMTDAMKNNTNRTEYVIAHYWDTLRKNAFGNYWDLLVELTRSKAIGRFLTISGSQKASETVRPDENYARELLQLFTIGKWELNIDGSRRLDQKGAPIPTYNQDDVENLARVFTGYVDVRQNAAKDARHMRFESTRHDRADKSFLGITVKGSNEWKSELNQTMFALRDNANSAPFVSKKLIAYLVTPNPSPGYVERVAKVFRRSKGSLMQTISAIFLDTEAAERSDLGRVRPPMIQFIQMHRTFGFRAFPNSPEEKLAISNNGKLGNLIGETDSEFWGLAQSPLRAPSVFGFCDLDYRPDDLLQDFPENFAAPEFQFLTPTALIARGELLASSLKSTVSINDATVKLYTDDTSCKKLLEHLNLVMAAGEISSDKINQMANGISRINLAEGPDDSYSKYVIRVKAAVLAVMLCPEYVIQH